MADKRDHRKFSSGGAKSRERERESTDLRPKQQNLFDKQPSGLPIGNLTSQLFANIYLNEFDYYIKHKLKIRNYFRYTDDFIIVDNNKEALEIYFPSIKHYLRDKLKLQLHPNKVEIRKFKQGVDFLGYVVLPNYIKIRSKSKCRIVSKLKSRVFEFKSGKISKYTLNQSLNSYIGTLSHANSHKQQTELKNQFWFWLSE